MCVCVSRSSHIIIYMFATFITTLQHNHIVTVWLVLSLLLDAYVNLLWCASVLVSWILSKDGRMIIPPPLILTFKSLQKCNKVPPKTSSHKIRTYIHFTHTHRYIHTILYKLSIWNIFLWKCSNIKKREAPAKQKPCTLT